MKMNSVHNYSAVLFGIISKCNRFSSERVELYYEGSNVYKVKQSVGVNVEVVLESQWLH